MILGDAGEAASVVGAEEGRSVLTMGGPSLESPAGSVKLMLPPAAGRLSRPRKKPAWEVAAAEARNRLASSAVQMEDESEANGEIPRGGAGMDAEAGMDMEVARGSRGLGGSGRASMPRAPEGPAEGLASGAAARRGVRVHSYRGGVGATPAVSRGLSLESHGMRVGALTPAHSLMVSRTMSTRSPRGGAEGGGTVAVGLMHGEVRPNVAAWDRLERTCSKECVSFVCQLLIGDPIARLGCGGINEVLQHEWLQDVDAWEI